MNTKQKRIYSRTRYAQQKAQRVEDLRQKSEYNNQRLSAMKSNGMIPTMTTEGFKWGVTA